MSNHLVNQYRWDIIRLVKLGFAISLEYEDDGEIVVLWNDDWAATIKESSLRLKNRESILFDICDNRSIIKDICEVLNL